MTKKFYSSRERRLNLERKALEKESPAELTDKSNFNVIESGYNALNIEQLKKTEEEVIRNDIGIDMAHSARQRKSNIRRPYASRLSNRKGISFKDWNRAKIIRAGALGALAMVLLATLGGGVLFAWYSRNLPAPDKIVRTEGFATKILDRNGETLYEVFVDEQRTPVVFEQIPETLRQATVAIEDKNFYSHGGFDPTGILRGVYLTIFTNRTAGGSTLTQQLVKNVLLTSERKLSRKVKEFILAVQIESKYNKDEILQMYLNEAPYGGTAWGVQTASQLYFNKNVQDINLVESAILAGMPQLPSVYTPFGKNPTAYVGRTEAVLRRMREDGYITKDEEASASAELEGFEFHRGLTGIKAPHFSLYVKDQLEEMYGAEMVEKGGLVVTTTLDSEIQEKAELIVAEEIANVEKQGIGNGAAMVMDSQTGEIWSMVGSKDFFAEDYDGQVNVALAQRQPGSAIKPVTYATAFEQGLTPATMLMDVRTEFPSGRSEPYVPVNYDGTYRGPIQLRFALGSSLNVPAVKLLALVGVDEMLKNAYKMGFTTLEPTQENLDRFGLAVTLGGGEVRLLDMVSSYSSFSNGGYKVEPISILKVQDRSGKTLFENKPKQGDRIWDEAVTFLVNHILSDNNARLLTFGANSYLNMGGRAVAVKTGTTNDKRDNWTVGWSNKGVVGVWVGNNDNSQMNQVASGVTGSSPIWRRIMLELLNKYPDQQWNVPANVKAVMVDQVSGYPEHDGFPARSEYIIDGTLPNPPDPVHTKLKICRGANKLATEIDIARNEFEEKEYFVIEESTKIGDAPSWQEGVNGWTSSQGDERYKPPTEYCDTKGVVEVNLDEPKNMTTYEGTEIEVKVRVISQGEVRKIDIEVDGKVKESLVKRPFEVKLKLDSGRHTIRAKAETVSGDKGESGEVKIGTGGVSAEEPTPTSEPAPTSKPTSKPEPSPTTAATPIPEDE
jgi:penicillin-binding protein 1C